MMNTGHRQHALSGRGFALIEVLITMAIVAVALFGTAGIIVTALKQGQGAQFRTIAVMLSTDIAERMEANKAAAIAGSYVVATSTTVTASTNCLNSPCSPAQLALFDLAQWQSVIPVQLPGGFWQITRPVSGNPSTYQIVIGWVDRRGSQTYSTGGTVETFFYTATKTIQQ